MQTARCQHQGVKLLATQAKPCRRAAIFGHIRIVSGLSFGLSVVAEKKQNKHKMHKQLLQKHLVRNQQHSGFGAKVVPFRVDLLQARSITASLHRVLNNVEHRRRH